MNRRFELREKTSRAHTALEGSIGPFGSLTDYHRYLQGMHSFRVPLEAWLSRMTWPAVFGTWRPVMIGAALAADMSDFGLRSHARMDAWGAATDLDTIFGNLYVVEGSMLGAQLLLKRAERLGLSENFGARHLAVQAATPANWQQFLAVLEGSAEFDVDKAARAANLAFGAAELAFTQDKSLAFGK